MSAAQQAALPPSWEEVWDEFWVFKRAAQRSDRTLENYRDTLSQLARFLGPKAPPLGQVTRRQVADFLEHVARQTSPSTAAMRYRGLSAVFGWLAKPGPDDEPYIERNPVKGLQPPKFQEEPVPVLSLEDAKQLVAACRGQAFEDRRDEAMIRMLYDTGCRRGELASMQVDAGWLSLRDGTAMVSGKTGPRLVAFGPKTAAAVLRYQRVRKGRADRNEKALWVGRKGPLLGNGIYQALARRFELAGLSVHKKAHLFRHTFSHEFRRAGGAVDDLVALNGWTTTAMALRYGRSAAAERAREAHRRLSLGDRL